MCKIIAAWGAPYKRILRGEIRGLQDHGGVASSKTDPGVFPGILLIRTVDNLGVRVDQKGVSSGQMVSLTGDAVGAFSGNDIVDQIVIADTGTPLVEGVTFLEADVVDGEGNQFFFGHFIGIFVMMWHRAHSLSFGW